MFNSKVQSVIQACSNSAGPGTGKTTTLVARYEHLIKQGVPAQCILCCTFARKASDELKQRIQKQVGVNTRALPIGTFHALANRAVKSLAHLLNIDIPEEVQTGIKRFIIIEEISKKHPQILEKLKFEEKKPSVILDSIDDFRERLLRLKRHLLKLVRWVTMCK